MKDRHFGWARGYWSGESTEITDTDEEITELVRRIGADLDVGMPVALGLECPLFVPIRDDPTKLTAGRQGEGSPAWSSQIGATVLVVGLTETIWILKRIRRRNVHAFLDWGDFYKAGAGVFFWEAFVTGEAKSGSHIGDATVGVMTFAERVPSQVGSLIEEEEVNSLIGAALLRTKWSKDLSLLETPCVVIKA